MGVLGQTKTIQNQNASQRWFLGEKLHQNQPNQPLCLLPKMYGYQIRVANSMFGCWKLEEDNLDFEAFVSEL